MVPRNEITALDLDEDWDEIMQFLTTCQHTRVPVFRSDINNLVGIIHMRRVIRLLAQEELDMESLEHEIREPYFIPVTTSLYQQLINFQENKRRSAMAVDEYGDIQGLVTLEDILEEVVGEFTTSSPVNTKNIQGNNVEGYLIAGNTHIREINRSLNWELPTDGPKTLNGLILEHLEIIPEPGTSLMIANHPIEITKARNNAVQMTRIKSAIGSESTMNYDENEDITDGG
jgi:Mg2+/Co2+ transporter CorB